MILIKAKKKEESDQLLVPLAAEQLACSPNLQPTSVVALSCGSVLQCDSLKVHRHIVSLQH